MKVNHTKALSKGRRATGVAGALLLLSLSGAIGAAAATAAASGSGGLGVVNVNTASAEELQLLPGVGEARAAAILELRKQRGGFDSVDELTDVKGIGPAMLERMRAHVTLLGRTTARSTPPAGPGKKGGAATSGK